MNTPSDIRGIFLDAQALLQRLTMPDAIASMAAAFGSDTENPARVLLGHSFFMPGRVGKFTGIKVVSTKPGNPTGTVTVYNADGGPIGTVDGTALTSIRTGAGSGFATHLLARKNASHLAMLGAGAISADQIEAVCCVRSIEEVSIWSRRIEAAEKLVTTMEARREAGVDCLQGVFFTAVEHADEAVQQADIVNCATPSRAPLFDPTSIQLGAHINAVGAFKPEMVEVPSDVILAARVYVDDCEAARREAGDLIQAECTSYVTLTELLADTSTHGRRDNADITLFKSVGVASQDVASATAAMLGIGALTESSFDNQQQVMPLSSSGDCCP